MSIRLSTIDHQPAGQWGLKQNHFLLLFKHVKRLQTKVGVLRLLGKSSKAVEQIQRIEPFCYHVRGLVTINHPTVDLV